LDYVGLTGFLFLFLEFGFGESGVIGGLKFGLGMDGGFGGFLVAPTFDKV